MRRLLVYKNEKYCSHCIDEVDLTTSATLKVQYGDCTRCKKKIRMLRENVEKNTRGLKYDVNIWLDIDKLFGINTIKSGLFFKDLGEDYEGRDYKHLVELLDKGGIYTAASSRDYKMHYFINCDEADISRLKQLLYDKEFIQAVADLVSIETI